MDFTDEAQYVVESVVPLLGGVPFVTDKFVQQSTDLLLTPLIRVLHPHKAFDGIFLEFRLIYFFLTMLAAAISFVTWRRLVSRGCAYLFAAMICLYVPWGIPSISYNTIGHLALIAGLHLGILGNRTKSRAVLSASGVTFAICLASYPTLFLTVASYLIIQYLVNQRQWSVMLWQVGAMSLAILALILFYSTFGFNNIIDAVSFSSQQALGGWEKICNTVLAASRIFGRIWRMIVLVGFLGVLHWQGVGKTNLFRFAAASLIVYRLWVGFDYISLHYVMTLLGTFSPILLFLARKNLSTEVFSSLLCLTVPSLLAALSLSYTSSNGFWSAGMGAFCGAQSAVLLLAPSEKRRMPWRAAIFPALFSLLLLLPYLRFSYRDEPPASLSARIGSGPYAGLFTTRERRNWLEEISSDIRENSDPRSTILFFPSFPAGYLFSTSRPDTMSVHLHGIACQIYLDEIKVGLRKPQVVFAMSGASSHCSLLGRFFRDSTEYKLFAERPAYRIYHRLTHPGI